MNDPASAARTARESLARGLSVLQSPGVPAHVMDVAEPVAQAMGALHRIEYTQGAALGEAAPVALTAVRRALGMLQAAAGQHPAVAQATEAVAGSLGVVHSLTQVAAVPAFAQPAPQAPTTAQIPAQPQMFQHQQPQAAPPFNPGAFPAAPPPFQPPPGNPYPAAPQ